MDKDRRRPSSYPLRMPPDLDERVRAYAQGDGQRVPSKLNDTIIFLLTKALEQEEAERRPRHRR